MPPSTKPEMLAKIDLFQGLTTQQLFWLKERLDIKRLPARYPLAMVGQPGEYAYIVVDGTLKVYVDQFDGTEVTLAILGPGDTVGELSLLDSAGRSANVITREKSTLLCMKRDNFWECLRRMPTVNYKLTVILCRRLRLGNENIKAYASLDIPGRVARQLLALADRYGKATRDGHVTIPLRLTQGDIASLIGASRERVNQIIVNYKQEGFISVDGRHRITIHEKEELVRRCQ